jgi:hypothetical protein
MTDSLKQKILSKTSATKQNPEIIDEFKLKTDKKNQLFAFFKPEVFLEKQPNQVEKILDLVFSKLEEYGVGIDGAALFPGPAIGKYSIMDKHYGVINTLSKNASKILSKDERDLVLGTLGVKNLNTPILGGHEAYEVSGFGKTYDFDRYWLEAPSTKIKSGFYVRTMKIGNNEVVVVNGFHPHQLAHYTEGDRFVATMLVSSDRDWATLRTEMLGETFPEKASPSSIRGMLYKDAKKYGFETVTIANNALHLSAGPTEALFEIDNFLNKPFGIDFVKEKANLSKKLEEAGLTPQQIRRVITNKEIQSELEHKNTDEAVKLIKQKLMRKEV